MIKCRWGGGWPTNTFHSPQVECIWKGFFGLWWKPGNASWIASDLGVIVLKHFDQEVYVVWSQPEGLDLGQLVGGHGGNNLSELSKGVVEGLGPLTLPVVSLSPLDKQLLGIGWLLSFSHTLFAFKAIFTAFVQIFPFSFSLIASLWHLRDCLVIAAWGLVRGGMA